MLNLMQTPHRRCCYISKYTTHSDGQHQQSHHSNNKQACSLRQTTPSLSTNTYDHLKRSLMSLRCENCYKRSGSLMKACQGRSERTRLERRCCCMLSDRPVERNSARSYGVTDGEKYCTQCRRSSYRSCELSELVRSRPLDAAASRSPSDCARPGRGRRRCC